ncbi:hypothetical protein DDE83_002542 [Stemphylium lycopersici]|uniref:Uncharacterized protein n=1 Tax=Stemphylium lycopersici TaxID=183478 RepID=A0A364N9U8_STELY|nr:hypothetical protein DDE83_002542 [Stemphylium lycopersici]
MALSPSSLSLHAFSRTDVQDVLDAAQITAGSFYSDTPCLRDQLQELFRDGVEECNSRQVDPIQLLHQTMFTERMILDAYNKHRLGNAVTPFNARVIQPENAVEYNDEENIPEALEYFPLRAEVSKRGIDVQAPPIYQHEGTAGENQRNTGKPISRAFKVADSPDTKTRPRIIRKKAVDKVAPVAGKKLTGFGSPSYNKLRDAPSPWLLLPSGNLTMAETTAFLPQAIKSFDVMDRFLFNGAFATTLAEMINHYRTMPNGPIINNTVYRMMKGSMDNHAKKDERYEKWTVTKHITIERPVGFDPTSVDVSSFRAPENHNARELAAAAKSSPPTLLFRDMANGVKIMPSGFDALDLTRCIEYCLQNKNEDWCYPQDFSGLVDRLGGPAAVHREHQDDAAIRRHTSDKKLTNAKRAGARDRDSHGRLLKQRKGFLDDFEEEEFVKRESDEDMSDPDFDALDGEEDYIAPTKKGSKRTRSPSTESSEEDPTPQPRKTLKRKRTIFLDDSDEEDALLPSRSSKRTKKSPPKARAPRSRKPVPSRLREAILPQDIESGSDSDVYVGPKQKNVHVATRASGRSQRYKGSYNVNEAFEVGGEENEEMDIDSQHQDDEDDASPPPKR